MAAISPTVAVAFVANVAVAVAKSAAALLTGSASMTAEAAHSWADAGNEVFLFVAERRGATARDATHPLGYGRETYFWSTVAAFGLFTVGAVVSILHGIQQLGVPEKGGPFWIAYLVLGVSAIFEGISFTQALRAARAAAAKRGKPTLEHVLQSSNPTLRAVFAEDSAALIGLGIAAIGILLHQLTGSAIYDAAGSILVGVLLVIVAIILIERNRRFLIGQVPSNDLKNAALRTLLERDDIDRVTFIHLEFVGPERVFLVAAVDLTGNETEERVAIALKRIADDLEENKHIEQAVLTLAVSDEESLEPT
ncbi:MAG: cation diffusion facilitator family transporter [Glaciihabitans sp.]|jgi:cation diffusion facilitator family transporter|nr:cation diffusion facilitator family transporter [Glaciihabitans sp.]